MTPEERAHAAAIDVVEQPPTLRRRLSWIRVLGVILAATAVVGAVVGFQTRSHRDAASAPISSFEPYVDVTATPQFAFEDSSQSSATNVVLGFVVSAPSSSCQPSWGAAYSLPAAVSGIDLDRRIARLQQRGGQVSVSFGGAANSELAIGCTDVSALRAAYTSVIDRYSVATIDLDIEGAAAATPSVNARRAQAISTLQAAGKAAGHPVAVWLTLPVSPSGLTDTGKAVLNSMLAAHVTLAGVNALTMDYGQPLRSGPEHGNTRRVGTRGPATANLQRLQPGRNPAGHRRQLAAHRRHADDRAERHRDRAFRAGRRRRTAHLRPDAPRGSACRCGRSTATRHAARTTRTSGSSRMPAAA